MAEQNKPPNVEDFVFGISASMGTYINELQKVLGSAMTSIEARKDNFPKVIILKWIPLGIEIAFVFTVEGIEYNVFTPEDILEQPLKYQEDIANVRDTMAKFGFKKVKEKGDVN